MKKIILPFSLLLILITVINAYATNHDKKDNLIVLCYHHISKEEPNDNYYTVSQKKFIQQLEFLKAHNYTFVSVQDLIDAKSGKKSLPSNAVLLTFDDGYESFYDFVYPVLKKFGYPSMLSIVGDWVDNGKPPEMPAQLMGWDKIAELNRSSLVEIASHSYKLHETIRYTPAGNVAAKTTSRQYFPEHKRYENEDEYRQRLRQDFSLQNQRILQHIGTSPRVMTWPYGRYNSISLEIAKEAGAQLTFNLESHLPGGGLHDPLGISRVIVDNWNIDFFAHMVRHPRLRMDPMRAMQVDLDLIYDPNSAEKTEKNLGELIERLVAMGVNTVFLQAFRDPDGSGNIRSVYFHNRVLPVAADIFGHAAHQISIRGIRVFAWMPTLSFVFPDQAFNDRFAVQEHKDGQIRPTSSWYKRLTPFSEEVRQKISMLYEDLAIYTQISGILFQDDAYLNDYEDMHPIALNKFFHETGQKAEPNEMIDNQDIQSKWTDLKKSTLNEFINHLMEKTRFHRPELYFARNIYANVLINPESETWFAQNYPDYLNSYDFTVIMAYPQMEKADNPAKWLKNIVNIALTPPESIDKVVFKLQTYDWANKKWVDDDLFLKEIRTVLSSGGRHIAYYPDNIFENKPDLNKTLLEMSTRTLPQ